jgi:hypothetical protein
MRRQELRPEILNKAYNDMTPRELENLIDGVYDVSSKDGKEWMDLTIFMKMGK